MLDFEYDVPATLDEAIDILSRENGAARPLAGGTDLIDHVRTGRLAPERLVDVKKIPELNVLEVDDAGARIGAAVPCYRIYGDKLVAARYQALADACRIIGGVQIQSRASLGGNICNSGPAADTAPALIALGAVCVIRGPGGERTVPVEEFTTAPGVNVLRPGELLVEFKLPARPAHSGSHYRRFIPRNEMDIAVVGVGASIVLDADDEVFQSARIALGAVAPTPLLAERANELLAGQPVARESLARAAEEARKIVRPIDDMRGTANFRRHVTGVLVERVLAESVARATGADTCAGGSS